MSDFDKEAEREKLRRRFEAEEEKRETTAQMSELLLQGATMTNRHCPDCHSPLFSYEDRTFCPTCQAEVDDNAGATAEEPAPQANGDAPPRTDAATSEPEPSSTRIEVDDPGTETAPARSPADGDASTIGRDEGAATDSQRPPAASHPTPTGSRPESDPAAREPAEPKRTDAPGNDGSDPLGAAQASLSRTILELSREAERSDDLSRTRDYLGATEDAADALAALKRSRR